MAAIFHIREFDGVMIVARQAFLHGEMPIHVEMLLVSGVFYYIREPVVEAGVESVRRDPLPFETKVRVKGEEQFV